MPICDYCGGEIEFRYLFGQLTPIHLSGGCSAGSGGGSGSEARRPENYTWGSTSSYAAPTRCPKCKDSIYFVRHNGGCVWLDELGWPWPKHACFVKEREPNWAGFLREQHAYSVKELAIKPGQQPQGHADHEDQANFFVGLIIAVRAKSVPSGRFIALAVEGSHQKRICIAIPDDRAPMSYLDCLVVINNDSRKMAASNHRHVELLDITVNSADLDLPVDWLDPQ